MKATFEPSQFWIDLMKPSGADESRTLLEIRRGEKVSKYRVPQKYRLKVNGSEGHKNGANQILILCMFSLLQDIWFIGSTIDFSFKIE